MIAQPDQIGNVVAIREPSAAEIFWQHPPGPTDRTYVAGTTGEGKTQFSSWLLSYQDFDRRPWLIFDYKREKLFRQLERLGAIRASIKPGGRIPKAPGLYLVRAMEDDANAVDDMLWAAWSRGNLGLYYDEGRMIPGGPGSGSRAIQIQGRSKRISTICCNQSPLNIDPEFKRQAGFFALFFMPDRDDRKEMRRYIPGYDPDVEHPRYQAVWYDCSRRVHVLLPPAPDAASILARIEARAPRRLWGWVG